MEEELRTQLRIAVELLDSLITQKNIGMLVIDVGKLNDFYLNSRPLIEGGDDANKKELP